MKLSYRLLPVYFALITLRGVATASSSPDWLTWRGNAMRTASTEQTLPDNLYHLWTRELGQPEPAWPASQEKLQFDLSYEPVVSDNRIYVGSMVADWVKAFDTATGNEVWRTYTGAPVRFAPIVRGKLIYIVSDDGYLLCLTKSQGYLQWRVRLAPDNRTLLGNYRLISTWPARGAPVMVEESNGRGTIYVAAGIWPFMGIFIYAIDAATGEIIWKNSGSGSTYIEQQHYSDAFAGVAPQGYMSVSGDILLVSGGRTVPAAYNRHTGKFLYFHVSSRTFGKEAGGYDVSVMGELFYNNGALYNTADGEPVLNVAKTSKLPTNRIGNSFTTVSSSGALNWYGNHNDLNDFALYNAAYKLPTKKVIVTNAKITQTHFRAGRQLFVSGNNGWIGRVNIPTGSGSSTVGWSAQVSGNVWTMIPGDNKLFVITREGAIHAFGAQQPSQPIIHPPPATPLPATATIPGPKGYALVWGVQIGDFDTLVALAKHYHVICVEKEPLRGYVMRLQLDNAGWFGKRIHILCGEPDTIELPPYFASLLKINLPAAKAEVAAEKAWHVLRPYHGLAVLSEQEKQPARKGFAMYIMGDPLSAKPGKTNRSIDIFARKVESLNNEGAELRINRFTGVAQIKRTGALKDSAAWTHENADAANTVTAKDKLVRPPLGLLWFGGPSHDDILPRHGHGPTPQVAGGRLFIEGVDALRAVDVYTGQLLWQRYLPGLGVFYDNTNHQPGANEIGSNYVSLEDGVYVVYQSQCLRLDPVTGDTVSTFSLPANSFTETPNWGYLGIHNDTLLAGSTPQMVVRTAPPVFTPNASHGAGSRELVALDRHSGAIRWRREAEQEFRHNAIAMGSNLVFCVDGMSQTNINVLRIQSGMEHLVPTGNAKVYALNIDTGNMIWSNDSLVNGTWLAYSEEYDILLETGSYGSDRATDEIRKGWAARRGSTGALLWANDNSVSGRPLIIGDTIYNASVGYSLFTGTRFRFINPITLRDTSWTYTRNYGCNTPVGSQYMILFRSAAAGYCDLVNLGGTGNWGGFKSGCTSNLIAADGVLSAPDYTRTCTCSYQNQCSLALVSMPDVETWTFQSYYTISASYSYKRLALNFGAPGNWMEPGGPLWLEYPLVGGRSPTNLNVQVSGTYTPYRYHALDMSGTTKQVTASGIEGAVTITIPINTKNKHTQTVRLFFAEPHARQAGKRVFDIKLQNNTVKQKLDIVSEAGGACCGMVLTFNNIITYEDLQVQLVPSTGTTLPPLICGIDIERVQ